MDIPSVKPEAHWIGRGVDQAVIMGSSFQRFPPDIVGTLGGRGLGGPGGLQPCQQFCFPLFHPNTLFQPAWTPAGGFLKTPGVRLLVFFLFRQQDNCYPW